MRARVMDTCLHACVSTYTLRDMCMLVDMCTFMYMSYMCILMYTPVYEHTDIDRVHLNVYFGLHHTRICYCIHCVHICTKCAMSCTLMYVYLAQEIQHWIKNKKHLQVFIDCPS